MSEKVTAPKANMAVITLGFVDYVLPVKQATEIMRCLETSERYQFRYRSEDEGGCMYHIWEDMPEINIKAINHDRYIQGKITGKPTDI